MTLDGVTVFAYDLPMIVYWLVGFIGGLPVTVKPEHVREVAGHRNRQLQLLALHELAVRDCLAPSGDDAVLHRQLALVHVRACVAARSSSA